MAKSQKEIQKAVNAMVWKYGKRVDCGPDYDGKCEEFGLEPGDVLGEMLDLAAKIGEKRHANRMKNTARGVDEPLQPVHDDSEESTVNQSDDPPSLNNPEREEETMQVAEKIIVGETEARNLLRAINVRMADTFSVDKVRARMNDLHRYLEAGQKDPEDRSLAKKYHKIARVLSDGGEVEVVPDGQEFEDDPAPEATTAKAKAEPKKAKPTATKASGSGHHKNGNVAAHKPPKATAKGPVDKFGCRIGSSKALINKVLSTKPKPVTQLIKEAGIKPAQFTYADKGRTVYQLGDYYRHMKKMTEAGFVQKVDDGYALVKAK